jgi:hypothetical protein
MVAAMKTVPPALDGRSDEQQPRFNALHSVAEPVG